MDNSPITEPQKAPVKAWPPMPRLPSEIDQQISQILATDIDEDTARRDFPLVFEWINRHLDLTQLIRRSGVRLRPLCAERPDILVGVGCPSCGGPMAVKDETHA